MCNSPYTSHSSDAALTHPKGPSTTNQIVMLLTPHMDVYKGWGSYL